MTDAPDTVRVVLADDQSVIRAGLRALLDAEPGIEVVGEAADGHEAVEQVRVHRPDVVVMDIRMPDLDGLEATRLIAGDDDLADVRIVVLTTFDLDEYVFEAIRAGATGFLLKDCEPEDLLRAVRCAASGEALMSPSVTRRLIAEFADQPGPPTAPAVDDGRPRADDTLLDQLTDREREVVAHVAAGLDNAEIAEALYISPATARTHVSRAMTKLGAANRAQLVVIAYESGLVRAGTA